MSTESTDLHITLALFKKDFQHGLRSWSVPVLKSNANVLRVRSNGQDALRTNYTVNEASGQLEWHINAVPTVLYVDIILPGKARESTSRWSEFMKVAGGAMVGAVTTVFTRWFFGAI